MTAYGSIPNVVKSMQLGASNYLVKQDISNELIVQIVRKALEHQNLRQDNRRLQEEIQRPYGFDSIVGQSQKIKEVLQKVKQIITASTDEPVLIRGETGTGKDLIANVIHYNSKRKNQPFRDFCDNIEALLENQLCTLFVFIVRFSYQ